MWTPDKISLDLLVKEFLFIKRELEEMKKRVVYLEDCLLLPEEIEDTRGR